MVDDISRQRIDDRTRTRSLMRESTLVGRRPIGSSFTSPNSDRLAKLQGLVVESMSAAPLPEQFNVDNLRHRAQTEGSNFISNLHTAIKTHYGPTEAFPMKYFRRAVIAYLGATPERLTEDYQRYTKPLINSQFTSTSAGNLEIRQEEDNQHLFKVYNNNELERDLDLRNPELILDIVQAIFDQKFTAINSNMLGILQKLCDLVRPVTTQEAAGPAA